MAILSNLCACPVECEAYSSGVMRSPATAGLILEIFHYIHQGTYFVASVVKIFACLDLEQNISFLDGHKLTTLSVGAPGCELRVISSGSLSVYPLTFKPFDLWTMVFNLSLLTSYFLLLTSYCLPSFPLSFFAQL
jgi:hypothetical protein